jgi:hypothetical protein
MTILTEAPRPGEAIISQAPGTRSREAITIMASQNLLANQVIGSNITAATVAAAIGAGNTGNGVLTLAGTPWTATARPGVYRVTFIEPVTNLGTFTVESPDGIIVGRGLVGTAYSNHVAFTIADGAADFVAGDFFLITVSAVTFQWGAYDPAATDGRAVPRGIVYYPVTTGAGVTAQAVAFVRGIEINSQKLQWLTGLNATARALAIELMNTSPAGLTVRT